MRIIYLHQYYNNSKMVGSTRSYEMAKRLVKLGHEVTIISTWREKSKPPQYLTFDDGIAIKWLHIPYSNNFAYYKRIWAFLQFSVQSFFQILKFDFDIIFASSTPLTIAIPGIFASKIKSVPFVFEVRDLWPTIPIVIGAIKNNLVKNLAFALENFTYRNSDGIVALSEGMKKGVIRNGYPENKVVVIPNGSDLELFKPLKENKDLLRKKYNIPLHAIVVLYPGTLGKVNGVSYLVYLAEKFKNDPRVYFVIVGDGLELKKITKLAVETNCINVNLQILPSVSKKQIPEFFECSDIIISTVIPLKDLEANSANKFFDGLSAGCCMVINHGGWQEEILNETKSGFRLSQIIEEAYLELDKYLSNPDDIYLFGANARKVAERKFDRDILANQLEVFLLEIYNFKNK